MAVAMLRRHPAAAILSDMVSDDAHQRHTALAAICRGQAEDPGRPDVVRRGGEIYDESRREEIRAFVAGLAALVDENVGERGGRVADIGRSREGVEDLADAAVDGG